MTTPTADDQLVRYSDPTFNRPIPGALQGARSDVMAAIGELRTIADGSLLLPWEWKGGSQEELRYGFFRIAESFDLAGVEAADVLRTSNVVRGRAADLIALATAARWDLQGLLVTLNDDDWDAEPGGGEWTIRQTLAHVIESHRYYGAGTAWWQSQGYQADDPHLPASTPDAAYEGLPTPEMEGEGSPGEVRDRLDAVLDHSSERLAGLPADRLVAASRWAGFMVDIAFRIGRWSSHIREHTVQVEKTLVTLDCQPTEVDRLVRAVLAAWGRAEAVVYVAPKADEGLAALLDAASGARATATEIAALARERASSRKVTAS